MIAPFLQYLIEFHGFIIRFAVKMDGNFALQLRSNAESKRRYRRLWLYNYYYHYLLLLLSLCWLEIVCFQLANKFSWCIVWLDVSINTTNCIQFQSWIWEFPNGVKLNQNISSMVSYHSYVQFKVLVYMLVVGIDNALRCSDSVILVYSNNRNAYIWCLPFNGKVFIGNNNQIPFQSA